MRSVLPICLAALLTVTTALAQPRAAQQNDDDPECLRAPPGSVEKLPPPVADWVKIVCTQTGQALAPQTKGKEVAWLTRRDGALFMLHAMPGETLPGDFSRYDMRFERFAAYDRDGRAMPDMLRMWDQAFGGARPRIDRVVQLDALSVWDRTVFNLFFYIAGGKPHTLIVCAQRCNRHISIDVVEP